MPGQNGSDGDLGMAGPRGDMVSLQGFYTEVHGVRKEEDNHFLK